MKLSVVEQWPEGFQQLLSDVWLSDRDGADELPAAVPVTRRCVSQYRDEVIEVVVNEWLAEDFERGTEYMVALRDGAKMPPLVVNGPVLVDGYHRVYAMLLVGIEEWDVIDLNCQPTTGANDGPCRRTAGSTEKRREGEGRLMGCVDGR